jgi:uncharacterized protein (TIGR02117 family)
MSRKPSVDDGQLPTESRRNLKSLWKTVKLIACRTSLCISLVCFFYVGFCVIGLWPVNRTFTNSPDGVEVFVSSNDVHADFILPLDNPIVDWSEVFPADDFPATEPHMSHIAVGWGDRGFYLSTPTWSDFKLSTATNAMLLPSDTVVHVQCMRRPRTSDYCRRIVLSQEQYEKLVRYVRASLSGGQPQPVEGYSYSDFDAFYRSDGNYHAFHTCNSWVGEGLTQAGVCTGLWTPLPRTVLYYLPAAQK